MSGVAGAVTDRVVGSLSDEERELGALLSLVLETEKADRWPESRFLIDGKRRLRRDEKLSVEYSPDLRRFAVWPGS